MAEFFERSLTNDTLAKECLLLAYGENEHVIVKGLTLLKERKVSIEAIQIASTPETFPIVLIQAIDKTHPMITRLANFIFRYFPEPTPKSDSSSPQPRRPPLSFSTMRNVLIVLILVATAITIGSIYTQESAGYLASTALWGVVCSYAYELFTRATPMDVNALTITEKIHPPDDKKQDKKRSSQNKKNTQIRKRRV